MNNKLIREKILEEISLLENEFNIDFSHYEYRKVSNLLGNFIPKIDKLFKKMKSHTLFFDFNSIDNKAFIRNDVFNKNSNGWRNGSQNTYAYIFLGMQYFGLINFNNKYSEEIMQYEGWYIPKVQKYDSLDEYLLNENCFKNNLSNKRFKKILMDSILLILFKYKIYDKIPEKILDSLKTKTKKQIRVFESNYNKIYEKTFLGTFKRSSFLKEDDFASGNITESKNFSNLDNDKNTLFLNIDKKLNSLNDIEFFKNKINDKYQNDVDFLSLKELVENYRGEFRRNFLSEFKDTLTSIENNNFIYPDLAHIVEVHTIEENWKKSKDGNMLKKIADPYNGLLLDPNTHRLWDRNAIKLIVNGGEYIFIDNKTNKEVSKIKKKFINERTTKYIEERLNNS